MPASNVLPADGLVMREGMADNPQPKAREPILPKDALMKGYVPEYTEV